MVKAKWISRQLTRLSQLLHGDSYGTEKEQEARVSKWRNEEANRRRRKLQQKEVRRRQEATQRMATAKRPRYELDLQVGDGSTQFIKADRYEDLVEKAKLIAGRDLLDDDFYIREVRVNGRYDDKKVMEMQRDMRGRKR